MKFANQKTRLIEATANLKAIQESPDMPSVAKIALQSVVEDLQTVVNDRKSLLLDLVDEFKRNTFCNKNCWDCLDCINHKQCDALRVVTEMVLKERETIGK